MPRAATGQVIVRARKTGRVFALRFRACGGRQHLTLGTDADGCIQRAEVEPQNVLADVRRGAWHPARLAPMPEPAADPTFHEFASEWFEAKRQEIRPNIAITYLDDLTNHLLPYFAKHWLSQVAIAEVRPVTRLVGVQRFARRVIRVGEVPGSNPGAPI